MVMNEPLPFIISLVVMAVVVALSWWHRRRWLVKHGADPKPQEPMIAAVSPVTGAVIATGCEALADASHTDGDGCGHFGEACHHDGSSYL
jgi:hypothetical protein